MQTNRSIPCSTVIPELGYADVGEAAAWLCGAFGFTLRLRIANHRAQLNVGEGAIVVTELRRGAGASQSEQPTDVAHSVMVRVEDVDAHCRQATSFGARVLNQPTTHPYGERQYSVEDPGGHRWTFTQSVADVAPEDWGGIPGEL